MSDEEEEVIDEAILTAVEMDDEEAVPAPPKAKRAKKSKSSVTHVISEPDEVEESPMNESTEATTWQECDMQTPLLRNDNFSEVYEPKSSIQ